MSGPGSFATRVVAWQRTHGRHGLPWQGTREAYRIWLSEIMLQQTQVSTVLRYYGAFLQRFPSVADLAAAHEDEVLAAWSGLGYYSRARNLHRCAQAVVQDHGGVFPTDFEVLQSLPGIGRSTAAAIAAFSAGQRVAILDGNVKRVLARHLAFGDDLSRPAALRALWAVAEERLPIRGIEVYTQGLMDLGATVCVLRRPRCSACPVSADCAGLAQGMPGDYPVKGRRQSRSRRESVIGLFLLRPARGADARQSAPNGAHTGTQTQVLLHRRAARGVWGGLWSLPEWAEEAAFEASLRALEASRPSALEVQVLAPIEHALTHFDWRLRPFRVVQTEAVMPSDLTEPLEWVPLEEALARGLPAPVRRLLEEEAAADY